MATASYWTGDVEATRRLWAAIDRNCTCARNKEGMRDGRCPCHQAMLSQRFLDGLLFADSLRERLEWEEHR